MKNNLILIAAVFLIACSYVACNTTESVTEDFTEHGPVTAALRSTPFSKGVNFSAWFESYSAESIPFTRYTEQDFIDAKSLGADVIRLPIRMHSMTNGAPDYILNPLFLKFLDIAIDWAEKHELYIIIDNHSFDPVLATSPDIAGILIPVWEQIARRYKDRSDLVIYEILNEPHGISDTLWGEIQGKAIDAIRRIDQDRLIIVGGTDYNSIGKLFALPRYSDPNLIYTFHFYDPYLFTHQGASWGSPPVLTTLAGVPFPADRSRMPRIPPDLRGTWIENSLNHSYSRDATPARIRAALDRAVAFALERDVPIFCGEFGVFMIQSPNEDRVRWYEIVTAALDKRNISRTSWDYYGGFGIFNSERGRFNHDLNIGVVRALGFTPPDQIPRVKEPLNTGFLIYDDYPNPFLANIGFWGQNVDFTLYDTDSAKGEFAIRWGNTERYNIFYFTLDPSKSDFSVLLRDGFFLEFQARTNNPVSFDVRFVNAESPSSIPWRMRYTIDENNLPSDGNWHTIRIPLNTMSEHGAWINSSQQWLSAEGKFLWTSVYQLEFVAEYSPIVNSVWFDEIKITQ